MKIDPILIDTIEKSLQLLAQKSSHPSGVGFVDEKGNPFFVAMEPDMFKVFWKKGHTKDVFPFDFQGRPHAHINKRFIPGFILVHSDDWFWSGILSSKVPKGVYIFHSDVIPRGTYHQVGEVPKEGLEFLSQYFHELRLIRKYIMIGFEREIFPKKTYNLEDELPRYWERLVERGLISKNSPIAINAGKVNTMYFRLGDEYFFKLSGGLVTESVNAFSANNWLPFLQFSLGAEPRKMRVSVFGLFDLQLGGELFLREFIGMPLGGSFMDYWTNYIRPGDWELSVRTPDERHMMGPSCRIYAKVLSDWFPLRVEYDPIRSSVNFKVEFGIGPWDTADPVPYDSSKDKKNASSDSSKE